jgi:glycosyltransferase involved in cell wall biosynthesis
MDEIPGMDISFIIIGYNESEHLKKCLASVQNADTEAIFTETIYVDGGSYDDSLEIARAAGVDKVLGGDKRRRAAENRNLGYQNSTGRYIQFIDGDMAMDPDWPKHAVSFLAAHGEAAAVCGKIEEMNRSAFYQAFQIDWSEREGEVASCGGSAMWRRDALEPVGGFPENVAYGEEPYLCWRVRNELGLKIHYLEYPMVAHNLNYSGFLDYWHRNVRCGETYAEIAHLCHDTPDRLWLKESISNLAWGAVLVFMLVFVLAAPPLLKAWAVIGICGILLRKTIQMRLRGETTLVSLGYAVHVYFSKLPLALGECIWLLRWLARRLPWGSMKHTKGADN